MIPSRSCFVGLKKACGFSKHANQRGAKSAKRVLGGLLSLLAPPYLRDFAARSACESIKSIFLEVQRPCCRESLCQVSLRRLRCYIQRSTSLCTPARYCAKRRGVVEALGWNRGVWVLIYPEILHTDFQEFIYFYSGLR